MSAGRPTRCIGVLSSSCARTASSESTCASASVSIPPTSMALTRIFGASSGAIARVIIDSAALAVAYAVKHGCTMLAERDEMLTIAPPPAATMCGTTSLLRRNADVTLKRKAISNDRSLVAVNALGSDPPALLSRMSMRPNSSTTRATRCSSCSVTVTSVATAIARLPIVRTSAAIASMSAWVRAAHATSAPASANARAQPAPMPLPAPVTIATRPSSRNWSRIT